MVLKLDKCVHSSTYPTGIFFYVLSALYVFRPFLQRHARSAVFFSSMLAKDFIITWPKIRYFWSLYPEKISSPNFLMHKENCKGAPLGLFLIIAYVTSSTSNK